MAFAYLIVGVAHHAACQHSTFTVSGTVELSTGTAEGVDGNFSIALCDHCPSCVVGLLPVGGDGARTVVASQSLEGGFVMPAVQRGSPDVPPPKMLI
jgi:uncharacterized Fe-S cluster protein YjdI